MGRFIVASGFMRLFYGCMKAAAFGYVLLIQPLPSLLPKFYADWRATIEFIKMCLVYATVIICIARAVPVWIEFLRADNDSVPVSD